VNALLSWLVVLVLFAVALLAADRIGQATDWVLDRMGWDRPDSGLAQQWMGTDEDWCPCEVERGYHARLAQDERDYLSMLDEEAQETENHL
jgi:hypothetical protein